MIAATNSYASFKQLKTWAIFFLYFLVAAYAMFHHEPWGDEIHSWNIAKASNGLPDLFSNIRYEGHPPVWYLILWSVSRFTHDFAYVQLVQLFIAVMVVWIILFFSTLPFSAKLLLPFGYYFLFEYGVLSRNYAVGVLAAFCICLIIRKEFKYKLPLYYLLLLIMSNSHLLALVLGASLHCYFLIFKIEKKEKRSNILYYLLVGIVVCLPAIYFIFPSSDSSLGLDFFTRDWRPNRFGLISKIPLRSFVPVPAWWNYNFWNTNFLTESQDRYPVLKILSLLLSAGVTCVALYILKNNKKSLAFFLINLLLSFAVSLLLPLTSARYIGFIFIGFIAACWLHSYETPFGKKQKWMLNALLCIQIIAGVFSVIKDAQLPFSNAYRIGELIKQVPANEKIVTDYWCVNPISAYTEQTFFCIGFDRKMSFLIWNNEFRDRNPAGYASSMNKLFAQQNDSSVYLLSTNSREAISRLDTQLEKTYHIEVAGKIEGSIEKSGNLFLYKIRRR